jgi:3-isopropylmalate dehydratase small subunit
MADAKDTENPELEIDLPNQVIRRPNGADITFDIDPFRKQCLLDGLDDIGLTMAKSDAISAYASKRLNTHPWL